MFALRSQLVQNLSLHWWQCAARAWSNKSKHFAHMSRSISSSSSPPWSVNAASKGFVPVSEPDTKDASEGESATGADLVNACAWPGGMCMGSGVAASDRCLSSNKSRMTGIPSRKRRVGRALVSR